jgi:hypothetical protein
MKCVNDSESVLVVRFWLIVILFVFYLHPGVSAVILGCLTRFGGPMASL